tara:strand:+ start:108162 stop:108941 length:780 start_codon:yes stop_codon:yes gene_type:complete
MNKAFFKNKWTKRISLMVLISFIYANFYYVKEPWLYVYYNGVKDFSMYEEPVPSYPLFPEFPGVDENNNGVLDRIEIKFLATLSHVPNPRRKWLKHYGMLMFENRSEAYTKDFTDDNFRQYWWQRYWKSMDCFYDMSDYLTYDLINAQKYILSIEEIYRISKPSREHGKVMRSVKSLFKGESMGTPKIEPIIIAMNEVCGEHKDYIAITKVMYENHIQKYPKGDDVRFFHRKVNRILHSEHLGERYEESFKIFNPFYRK